MKIIWNILTSFVGAWSQVYCGISQGTAAEHLSLSFSSRSIAALVLSEIKRSSTGTNLACQHGGWVMDRSGRSIPSYIILCIVILCIVFFSVEMKHSEY